MFDQLTDQELYLLMSKLNHAEQACKAEFDQLTGAGIVTYADLTRHGYDAPYAGAYAWQGTWAELIQIQLAL